MSQKNILRQKHRAYCANTFVSKNEIVFSQSLESAEDKNTKIVRTNLQDEIVRLKHEQGKNILIGGVSIASQLIESLALLMNIVLSFSRSLQEKGGSC
jgi:dihydrofolate reductase